MSYPQLSAAQPVRLSGAWIDLQEALVWVQTRNAVVARDARRADLVEAAVAMLLADANLLMSQDEAEDALLEALRHGDVAAKGRRGTMRAVPDGALLEAISEADWSSLELRHAGNRRIARSASGSATFEVWHDLLFEARSLTAWLPEPRLFDGLAEALAERVSHSLLLIEQTPQEDALPTSATPPRDASTKRGRPSGYPWGAFQTEAIRKLEYEGGIGAEVNFSQADLERHMIEWCDTTWERSPVESTIRMRAVEAIRTFKADKGREGR